MNLQKLIPKRRYTCRAYLHMLTKLLPRGPAWKFPCVPQSPTWVSLPTFLGDDFEDMLFDERWDAGFKSSFSIQFHNNIKIAIQTVDSGTYKSLLTNPMTGDFQIEFSFILLVDSGTITIRARNLGATNFYEVGYGGGDLFWREYTGSDVYEFISCPFALNKTVSLRIIRSGSTLTAQYKINNLWRSFVNSYTSSEDLYIDTYGTTDNSGFINIYAQATSELPEINYIQEAWFIKLLSIIADELCRYETEVMKLLRETVPGLSYESLGDWETTLGLPDEGTPTNPTVEQRQAYAHMKYTQGKGDLPEGEVFSQSKAYYIQYAASLGITITIDDGGTYGTVWRWTTKSPGVLQRVTQMPVGDIDGSRFGSIGSPFTWYVTIVSDPQGNRSIIEAVFEKVKPAHTQVVFLP